LFFNKREEVKALPGCLGCEGNEWRGSVLGLRLCHPRGEGCVPG
jgi:hypothetical protein